MAELEQYMREWTPVERAYSLWIRAARERKGGQAALARALQAHLRKEGGLKPEASLSVLGVQNINGATIGRWERGTGATKSQPQFPADQRSREALIAVVTDLVPNAPVGLEGASFQDVCAAFDTERLERIERGADILESHAAQERNKERHQFLATWPAPASDIDPITLGLGSWAFDGALPPYVDRTIDGKLAARLREPGITVVTGAPKSGKSRSIFEVLCAGHPGALTWWVKPTPTVLPLVVEHAKKAKGNEKPAVIVLDDAGLIGTDPVGGLTARRLSDLADSSKHVVMVIHAETLASWERQLTHHTADFDAGTLGASRELLDLLAHRIRYSSVLDEHETTPAAEAYEDADDRVKSFDLTRLAETFAGVEMFRKQAAHLLETPTSVEAALLEAAIDASIAFPAGAAPEIHTALAKVHYRRRQPNRPLRENLFNDAFDTLTTGITVGSPHAILITTDYQTYRLLDVVAPELQHPNRDTLSTLLSGLSGDDLDVALFDTGLWYFRSNHPDMSYQTWEVAANRGTSRVVSVLGILAKDMGDLNAARTWWEQGAASGDAMSMAGLGDLAIESGDKENAQIWWERAADHGIARAMLNLAVLADAQGKTKVARTWLERAAGNGDIEAIKRLASRAYAEGDAQTARARWEQAVGQGDTQSMFNLGALADEAGDRERARIWFEKAADNGHGEAMFNLGLFASASQQGLVAHSWWKQAADKGIAAAQVNVAMSAIAEGDLETARAWLNRAAESGDTGAMFNLASLAKSVGDIEGTRTWCKRAAESGNPAADYHFGVLAFEADDPNTARIWFERAAESGNPAADFHLGVLAFEADDPDTARTWFERAAEGGNAQGMFALGLLAQEAGNLQDAVNWLERAAEAGDSEALEALAAFTEDRSDVSRTQR